MAVNSGKSILSVALCLYGLLAIGWQESARYPEGALNAGGKPIWVEMRADRVVTRVDGEVQTLRHKPGCGPTGVQPATDGWWVLCHLSHRLWRLDQEWQEQRSIRVRRPNAAIADGEGGLYLSSSGEFSLSARATGQLIHVDASGERRVLMRGLRYANGVALSADAAAVFVSEHLARRIWRVPLDGGEPTLFFDFANAPASGSSYRLAGPDGLMARTDGGLVVAEYGAGRLLWLSPHGEFEGEIPVDEPFVTSIAALPDGLLVTGSTINNREPWAGSVQLIDWSALSDFWPAVSAPADPAPDTTGRR